MIRAITIIFILVSAKAFSWEPHFHELVESKLTADLGHDLGRASVEMVLNAPNGKIESVVIRSNYGETTLDASQFIGIDIVRLSQLSIVSFGLGMEGFDPSFSACVPYGKGKFVEENGAKKLLMPVLGIRTTAKGSNVFKLPIPEDGIRREDHDGCFYLSEQ
ncbi:MULTISPECIES: hypothetical protein [unclassified Microbulbifer]|uniref:hypothetical protein n=1 Tax=unclassified Microbulbifer TaxID=2619833 RepID=UPI0027E54408|nr:MULTISPECIES: hypothetical protein [unclassified Microbulbifer]